MDWKRGRSLQYDKAAHNRLLLAIAHGFGHRLETFGNPEWCEGGVLGQLVEGTSDQQLAALSRSFQRTFGVSKMSGWSLGVGVEWPRQRLLERDLRGGQRFLAHTAWKRNDGQ
eukprot:TRINITY_DN28176_c0_g1_i2.p2 TRINITY_DN28176_c0_g1~~TRINITY_DN28176_c0_g1_i2.p2  ORF type:complete len:129 (-),score=16.65 TRINITY_DN28176_c0_g1_i2:27-365(-)